MDKFNLTWIFKNKIEEIVRLSELLKALQAQHNFLDKTIFHIHLVLDELMTNIISYGYAYKKEHDIHVQLEYEDPHCIHITLQDDGVPFNPLLANPPDFSKGIEDRPIGGLGVHFAKTFTTDIVYDRKEPFNLLKLTFPTETTVCDE